jgi:hypothetical protein
MKAHLPGGITVEGPAEELAEFIARAQRAQVEAKRPRGMSLYGYGPRPAEPGATVKVESARSYRRRLAKDPEPETLLPRVTVVAKGGTWSPERRAAQARRMKARWRAGSYDGLKGPKSPAAPKQKSSKK